MFTSMIEQTKVDSRKEKLIKNTTESCIYRGKIFMC